MEGVDSVDEVMARRALSAPSESGNGGATSRMEEVGTSGRVSDHVTSDRIVADRPVNQLHIVVYRLPDDDENVFESPHEAHDVTLREAEDDEGIRRARESLGFFASAEEAAERAVRLADENDCIVWDSIIVLRCPSDTEE